MAGSPSPDRLALIRDTVRRIGKEQAILRRQVARLIDECSDDTEQSEEDTSNDRDTQG